MWNPWPHVHGFDGHIPVEYSGDLDLLVFPFAKGHNPLVIVDVKIEVGVARQVSRNGLVKRQILEAVEER